MHVMLMLHVLVTVRSMPFAGSRRERSWRHFLRGGVRSAWLQCVSELCWACLPTGMGCGIAREERERSTALDIVRIAHDERASIFASPGEPCGLGMCVLDVNIGCLACTTNASGVAGLDVRSNASKQYINSHIRIFFNFLGYICATQSLAAGAATRH